VPHADNASDRPAQSTQAKIGPYELQDFNLYYTTRYGFRPSKVAFLSYSAWRDKGCGVWPEDFPADERREYDLATIVRWLEIFLYRFFKISQFKRSALPNGPKVGSGGSLSPRGDWRAPSDSEAAPWLEELHTNAPTSKRRRGPDRSEQGPFVVFRWLAAGPASPNRPDRLHTLLS